jgi:peptidoglycan hydrolase-like protein with peptidoglycan-binding domain
MIDLEKQYGTYEGITFYGDHLDDTIVYYLPDEVTLGEVENPSGDKHYAMDLMLFNNTEEVSYGDPKELEGSILTMDVVCTVEKKRYDNAFAKLKASVNLPDNVKAPVLPLWKDGKVDIIVLDKQMTQMEEDDGNGFVATIAGSTKPSLGTTDLKSIFNVRMDRNGSEIVYSALKGNKSSLAGVMYDLQYQALLPAADLRITANLSKCQETASHELGIGFTYTGELDVSLSANLSWLTKKMEENSSIKVELNLLTDSEEEREKIQKLKDEFMVKVWNELFTPIVSEDSDTTSQSAGDTSAETTGDSTKNNQIVLAMVSSSSKTNRRPVLKKGMRGDDVRDLQNQLKDLDYLEEKDVDGQFGSKTRKAVKAFQMANDLTVDGEVGEKTWAALDAAKKPSPVVSNPEPKPVLKNGSKGDEVRELQKKLKDLGYLKQEDVNGQFDANTEEAVKAFQKEQGLKQDGIADEKTQSAVDDAVNQGKKPTPPKIGLTYVFKKTKIETKKVITVDYRERSSVIKTHNPQAHLWGFALQLGDNLDKYVTIVPLGKVWNEIWKNQKITVSMEENVFDSNLKFAEVAFWKKEYGLDATRSDSKWAYPDGTPPFIANLRTGKTSATICWDRDDNDDSGYYYQVCFHYGDQEIVSVPFLSYNGELIIVPEHCIFYKKLSVKNYGINFTDLRNVDVRIDVSDPAGIRKPQYIYLTNDNDGKDIVIRGRYRDDTLIQVTRKYVFPNGTTVSSVSSISNDDVEIPVCNPLFNRKMRIYFSGTEDVDYVNVYVTVKSADFDGELEKHFRINDFSMPSETEFYSFENGVVSYRYDVVTKQGVMFSMEGGVIERAYGENSISIDLTEAISQKKNLIIEWDGCSPEDAGLSWVKVFIAEKGKEETPIYEKEFNGSSVPAPVDTNISVDAEVIVSVQKRHSWGYLDKPYNVSVDNGKIIVQCS